MSDQFEQGFFVREPAWHGKGIVLAEYPGREEAMRLAGHAWSVLERPVFVPSADEVAAAIAPSSSVEGWKALVRGDDGTLLSVVRSSYEVIQNATPWDTVDAIIGQAGVRYDTGGVLDGGKVLWVTCRLDEPQQVPGDPSLIFPFIAASWSHDGSGAFTVDQTTVRRVCANTHKAARSEADKTGRTFTFRHTKNVAARIDDARDVLAGVRRGFSAFMDMARELSELPVSDAGLEAFVRAFIPTPAEALISERVKGNVEDARAIVTANLNGATCEGIRNTAWGLTCAATEYLDYGRRSRGTHSLLNRTLLSGERAKDDVVALARRTAEAFPV